MGKIGEDGEYVPDGSGEWTTEVRMVAVQHLMSKHGATEAEAARAYDGIGKWTAGLGMFDPGHVGIKDAAVLALREVREGTF